MADDAFNPLAPPDHAMAQRIRERAYHLWEADGCPDDSAEEYWSRAEILTRMEEAPHAGELPNPATQPGADPLRTQIVEEASIQENLGEFPDRFSDQGERQQTPSKKARKAAEG
jgi:hypothetical protein